MIRLTFGPQSTKWTRWGGAWVSEAPPRAVEHQTEPVRTGGILDPAAEVHARALIDQAMLVIGDALQVRLEPHLECAFGPEWSTQVRPRRGRFGRRDLASYAQCLLGEGDARGTRDEFRAALGVPMSAGVDRALRAALRVRNSFAHPDRAAGIQETKNDFGQLLLLAKTLNLDCIDNLQGIARQVETLSREGGALFLSSRQVQELQERAEQAVSEADHLRQQWMSAEAAREHAHDQLMRTRDDLQEAQAARLDADARAQALRLQLADADAHSAGAADLERQVQRATEQAAEQAAHLAETQEQLAALQQRLETNDRQVDEAARLAEAAEAGRDDLAGSVAFDGALAELPGSTPDDQPAQVDAVLARLTQPDNDVSQQDQPFPAPGQAWPFPRGREVWTLSGAAQSLTTADGLWSLEELLGPELAAHVIDSFIAIRPEGGRVWVDEDGDAVTYIDNVLTYLGRLIPDPEDRRWNPPIGTPYPRGRRRYTVTPAGVEKPDGTCLTAVIEIPRAQAVLERLLAVRPQGGVFRVNSTGALTTYLDGAWVFAGRLEPEEWFPGEIPEQ